MRPIALLIVCFSLLSFAGLPRESEAQFSKASLLFQDGNSEGALKILESLLQKNPGEVQVLELKALILKSSGHLKDAKALYQELFLQAQANQNKNKTPAYAFELGNVCYSLGQFPEAKTYLQTAIEHRFNQKASEFLLGKIHWEENSWKKAREYFQAASESEAFSSASKLYLAQAYQKENRASDALGAFVEAKESAEGVLGISPSSNEKVRLLAEQVLQTAEKELRTFSKNQWLSEVGLSTSYDSNVLFMPNSGDANNTSTTGSVKQSAHWRLRYASNPTERWQYLGSYQGSVNYNFNDDTRAGQFLVQDFSHFVTRGYLKSTQYGLKVGGSGIFQYQTDAYKPFNLSGSFGPYTKTALNDSWSLGLEAFFQPNRNFLDPTFSDSSKRSGWEQVVRAFVAARTQEPYWTPSIFLTGTLLRPNGSDFSGTRVNVDLANSMYLSSNVFLAQIIGVSASRFPDRTNGERNDQGFSAGVSGGYQIDNGFTLIAQMDYGQNFSNDPNFRFNRWTTTLSGNYRF